jgi:hypothetical protein
MQFTKVGGMKSAGALTLLVALVVLSLIGTNGNPADASTHGGVRRVGAADHRYSEFMTARSPRNPNFLAVGAMDWDAPQGSVGCAVFVSQDGGQTWNGGSDLPINDGDFRGDPWVAIDRDGRLHLMCLGASDSAGWPMHYMFSDDRGRTWSDPIELPTLEDGSYTDKGALAVDQRGHVYACFDDGGLVVTRSVDRGYTWQEPQKLGVSGNCNGIEVAPSGDVFVSFLALVDPVFEFGATGIVASRDGGATWDAPVQAGIRAPYEYEECVVTPIPNFCGQAMLTRPFPNFQSFAVSPRSGSVFIAYNSYEKSEQRQEIHLWRSTDGGHTFADVDVELPEEHFCASCNPINPTVAVDKRGRLGLQWTLMGEWNWEPKEFWFSASADEGDSWTVPVNVSQTAGYAHSRYDPRHYRPSLNASAVQNSAARFAASGNAEAFLLNVSGGAAWSVTRGDGGDYFGISSSARGFLPMWIAHDAETGLPQIWVTTVKIQCAKTSKPSPCWLSARRGE